MDRRLTSLRKMAWGCTVLVLAIVSLSAFIRLASAGLGCEPWPRCYGDAWHSVSNGLQTAPPPGVLAARIAHRILAVAALLVIIAMMMTAYSKSPVLRREGRLALALMALALFLAILGRWTAGSRLPAVTLGNLLAGFAMLAVSWRLALPPRRGAAALSARFTRWAWLAVALLLLQILLGGLVSASHSGLSCPTIANCDTASGSWQLLNPWHETSLDPSDPARPTGALVQWLHRAGALLVVAVLLPLGVAAWRRGKRIGAWLAAAVLLEACLGALLVARGLPLAVALAHNLLAAIALAVLLAFAAPDRRAAAASCASQEK